ncbi:hypothetical protein MMC29_003316 [Sticta canariensis]|nr:hypothetical protein [Sticta canariensis]
MAKHGPRATPANMFELGDEEAYAGFSKQDWGKVFHHLEFFKSVKLDDIEPENGECDICRQSFCSTDDGRSPEIPISLPCGHVFGMDCISNWITVGQNNHRPEPDDDVDQEQPKEVSSINSFSLADIDQLLPQTLAHIAPRSFTCPNCRRRFTIQRLTGVHAGIIEKRLQFWDSAYEKLGIQLSAEEEVCRDELWRFVKESKLELNTVRHEMHWLEIHARVSAMRFALRRGQSDLTAAQRDLRDALFNLGCCGVDNPSEKYRAESYEDRKLPVWCWQFEQIERKLHPMLYGIEKRGEGWEQQTLGEWRQKLFAEITEIRKIYSWNWLSGH